MIQVNEYFDGTVKSLGYNSNEGKSSVGVIDAGVYEFNTASHEIMNVIEGEMEVLIKGDSDWKKYGAGQSFEVSTNSSFKVKVDQQTSYLCKYR